MLELRALWDRRSGWLCGVVAIVVALGGWKLGERLLYPELRWSDIRAAVDEHRWAEAEDRLLEWLQRSPRDSEAWLTLGRMFDLQGRNAEAMAALRKVNEPDAAWVESRLLIGEIWLKKGWVSRAEAAFRAALVRNPSAVDPLLRLAHLLTLQQRTDEARDLLWRMYRLTKDPQHLVALVRLAATGPDARDPSLELDGYLRRTPDNHMLQRARGMALFHLGRPAAARPHLEFAAASFEDDAPGRLALAECRLSSGESRDIDAQLGSPPPRPADLSRWWLVRGQIDEAQGRPDRAIECLQKAVSADPQNRAAHYRLGQALFRKGDAPAGQTHLARAETIRLREVELVNALDRQLRGAQDAESYQRLGFLCREAGLNAEARAWFEQAVGLDPTRLPAQAALAQLGDVPDLPSPSPLRARRMTRPVVLEQSATPAQAFDLTFEDVATRAGIAFQYECGANGNLFIGDTMGGGVGVLDLDEDGWLDLYFVNGCRPPYESQAPNRLYRNRGDGTFEDVTQRAGVAGRGYGMGCAVGDYDNDGHDDLFVTGLGQTVLYRNRGDGTFEDVTEKAGVHSSRWTTAAGFGDLDGDGDLDLVAVTYVEADPTIVPDCRDPLGMPMHCPPGRFPPQFDHLFRNNGDGTFTDMSRSAGLEVPNGDGLGLAIADLDGDGKLDLFVANDAAPNFLFRNLGGLRFEEVGAAAGVAYDATGKATASMGVVCDDLDGDGRIDLFHTNLLNEPNTYLRNLGNGLFADLTAQAGLDAPSRPMTGFGTVAFDADNNGWLELFVANGHVDDRPRNNIPMAQLPQLFVGLDDGRFAVAPSSTAAYFSHPMVGRGAAAGDFDNDGRVDLVVVHRDAPIALLRNMTKSGHWLAVRLRGTASGKTPVGAHLICHAGGHILHRWLSSGTSYLSSTDQRLWFGLGRAAEVESLEVRWPSGAVQTWTHLAVDRIVDLCEGCDRVEAVPDLRKTGR